MPEVSVAISEDGASHRRLELPLNNEHQTYPSDNEQNDIIIYRSKDGKVNVALMTREGKVWLNQMQIAKLFGTSKQSIGQHIAKILKDRELDADSTVKYYFTVATNGRQYKMIYYSLEMILAIGYRVRGVQFRQWRRTCASWRMK